jgi:hypothetical protein
MKPFYIATVKDELDKGEQHPTLAMAEEKAEEMAREYPGVEIIVLQGVGICQSPTTPVKWDRPKEK